MRRSLAPVLTWAFLIALSSTCLGWADSSPAASDRDALGYMSEGFLRNRESFNHVQCRFRLTEGKAASVEDALAGKLSEPVRSDGLWLVNGDKVKFALICDPAVLNAALKRARSDYRESNAKRPMAPSSSRPAMISVPCLNDDIVRFGRRSISYGSVIGAANLFTEDMRPPTIRQTPFSINAMGPDEIWSPGTFVRDALAGSRGLSVRFEGKEKIGGAGVMVASVQHKEGHVRRFHLDPQRGFLAVRLWCARPDGKKLYQAEVLECRQCSRGRWFPMRSVVIHEPDGKAPLRVERYEVTELDVEHEPADDAFYVDLDAGTQVNIPDQKVPWYVVLKAKERAYGKDLAALQQRCVDNGNRMLAEREALTGQPASRPFITEGRLVMIGMSTLFLLALATGWVVWHRRRA